MKYFTKEWYELSQKTSFHLHLEEEKKAATFSEDYFQQLYNIELNNWLTLQEEIDSISKSHDIANKDENNHFDSFKKDEAIKQFHDSFIYNQVYLKELLPKAILQLIADLRVFALNKASSTVINAVTKFCEENERSISTARDNYRRYYKEASISFGKEIVEKFGFHDCTIIKSVPNGKSLTLRLDNKGGFTNIDEVTFENFNIIKQDDLLEDTWWLYEEVYKVNDKYEFHVLLQNREMRLIDFIISADQVSFYSNKK